MLQAVRSVLRRSLTARCGRRLGVCMPRATRESGPLCETRDVCTTLVLTVCSLPMWLFAALQPHWQHCVCIPIVVTVPSQVVLAALRGAVTWLVGPPQRGARQRGGELGARGVGRHGRLQWPAMYVSLCTTRSDLRVMVGGIDYFYWITSGGRYIIERFNCAMSTTVFRCQLCFSHSGSLFEKYLEECCSIRRLPLFCFSSRMRTSRKDFWQFQISECQ